MSELKYRYCLSSNDESIIKMYNKSGKKLSSNAEKTLIILSEVFGGLHHIDSTQLKHFDYQSDFYNRYLFTGSMATFDGQILSLLVIIAHDMAVRVEVRAHKLNNEDAHDAFMIDDGLHELESEYNYKPSREEFCNESRPYLEIMFHERKREGRFDQRHPTIEDTTEGFRSGNKHIA